MKKVKEYAKFIFFLVFGFVIESLRGIQVEVKRMRVATSKLIYKVKYCWRMFVGDKAKAEELIDPVELKRRSK